MFIVISIILLSFLVIIHELGHFFAAKWAGIKVEEFGLGYPPKALKLFKKWDTEFTLNWIPFGGFVRMKGEEATWEEQAAETSTKNTKRDAFYQQSAFKKIVVILAGATINFIFGVIAFAIVFSLTGIPTLWDQARIGAVQENTPAALAKLPTNVNIVAVKQGEVEESISSHTQAAHVLEQHQGQTITLVTSGPCDTLTCPDTRQEFTVHVRSQAQTPVGEGALGIIFQLTYPKFYPWYQMPFRGAVVGIEQAIGVSMLILHSFADMIVQGFRHGAVPQELMSPIGIVNEIGKSGVIQEGFLAVLQLAGMISINLAILNVMPVPALDGSRVVFIVLGQVLNKKRLTQIESYVQYAGLLLLVILLLYLSIRDIYTIIIR